MTDDPALRNAIQASPDRVDLMTRLRTATPGQIDNWIDNNVVDLASARMVLKALVKAIALDFRT